MALGDTQEVVIAIVAATGTDRYGSIDVLKHNTRQLHSIYPYLAEKVLESKPTLPSESPAIPLEYSLQQNYPNPFNPSTQIEFSLPLDLQTRLAIYDVLGREVRVLYEGEKKAGSYTVTWDGRDAQGNTVPSGIYLYRLQAGHIEITRRLVMVR